MTDDPRAKLRDVGLLLLRLASGGMMLGAHGVPKLQRFGDLAGRFPDPLGVGSATSLTLAVFAEVGCAAALIVGLGTRLAAAPLAFTMVIAGFVVHAADPWAKKELALFYLVTYLVLMLTGAGRYALDARLKGRVGDWLR